jgi:hypothetical protein
VQYTVHNKAGGTLDVITESGTAHGRMSVSFLSTWVTVTRALGSKPGMRVTRCGQDVA